MRKKTSRKLGFRNYLFYTKNLNRAGKRNMIIFKLARSHVASIYLSRHMAGGGGGSGGGGGRGEVFTGAATTNNQNLFL